MIMSALLHTTRSNLINVLFTHTHNSSLHYLPGNLPWCCFIASYNAMIIVCCIFDTWLSGKESPGGAVVQCRLKCAGAVHFRGICKTGLCHVVFGCIDVIDGMILISILSTDKGS